MPFSHRVFAGCGRNPLKTQRIQNAALGRHGILAEIVLPRGSRAGVWLYPGGGRRLSGGTPTSAARGQHENRFALRQSRTREPQDPALRLKIGPIRFKRKSKKAHSKQSRVRNSKMGQDERARSPAAAICAAGDAQRKMKKNCCAQFCPFIAASYFVAELLNNTLYQKLSDICHI